MGNWFDKSSRGVIFGIWNSHTNVGNILGAVIAGAFVDYNWGLSFIVPGVIIGVSGFILFLFLVPCMYIVVVLSMITSNQIVVQTDPEEVDMSTDDIHNRGECGAVHTLSNDSESSTEEAICVVPDQDQGRRRKFMQVDDDEIDDEMRVGLVSADNSFTTDFDVFFVLFSGQRREKSTATEC